MPGLWNDDDFTEGGLSSVEEFVGRLTDVEDDVEGKFGLQKELHFSDCEIIEAGDDVTLDEGRYTAWVKQSNRKNSTDGKMVTDWIQFAKAHDMAPVPSCFYNVLLRWRRTTYDFGDDMSPGRAFVPVEVVADESKKPRKSVTKGKSTTSKAPPTKEQAEEKSSELPQELVDAIRVGIGEDGATREMLRRHLSKKASLRTMVTKVGGIEAALEAMDGVMEDEGTYTQYKESDIPF